MRARGKSTRGVAQIMIVGVDDRGMGLIREHLGTEAALPTSSTAYESALHVATKVHPDVVIMGFDGDFDEAVRLGPQITAQSKGVQLVAISQRTDPERIRAAMRAGYREYVVLPEDAHLLRQAVHESAFSASEDDEQGQVVAIVGSKGGAGCSLLTTNLAAELAPLERVCVVDMDFSMGDIAAYLDLTPRSSIQDLLHHLARLDERMLSGSVAVHRSKVHVLPQPLQLGDFEDINGDNVLRVLTAVAQGYQHILVDCGMRIDEATLMTTGVADLVFLVCTPDVPAVRNAWRRLKLMESLEIDKSVIRLIINKWDNKSSLSKNDIEANLGIPIAATIAHDRDTCRKAVNQGVLVSEVDSRSPTARDISTLVSIITEGVARVETDGKGGGRGLGWFFKK